MSRARIAGAVFVVCGVTMVGLAADSGWLRRRPAAERPMFDRARQDDLRNAARVVQMAAQVAAERPAPVETAPPSLDAGDSEPTPADAKADGTTRCGGEACAAGQFCCGPPACGHCANRLTGPRCPATCL
jgi:hypothetical protein